MQVQGYLFDIIFFFVDNLESFIQVQVPDHILYFLSFCEWVFVMYLRIYIKHDSFHSNAQGFAFFAFLPSAV